jgi:hypothetical protein
MAIIFNNIEDRPQTHILIIGVGEYPFLKGGKHFVEQTFEFLQNIGQLTSTSKSATEFCQEMLNFHNTNSWITPLGSIELLTEESTKPTRDNVEDAYFSWKTRCETHSDNVAIFYFAGHGFTKGEKLILALTDFGKSPRNPWKGCMPFTDTRTAFHGCKARTQFFLIDACRNIPPDTLLKSFDVASMDTIENMQTTCDHDLTLYAAAPNESAFGTKGEVSYFTKAILNGMKSYGATNEDDQWVVSTGSISTGINKWMEMIKPSEGYRSRCEARLNDPVDLLRLTGPPDVTLLIDCDPVPALEHADLECSNELFKHNRTPDTVPWQIVVKAGFYKISAVFAKNDFNGTEIIKPVRPPHTEYKLKVLKV